MRRLWIVVVAACLACSREATQRLEPGQQDAATGTDVVTLADASEPDSTESYDSGTIDAANTPDSGFEDASPADSEVIDGGTQSTHRPIVLVHGINGSASEFDLMVSRLVAAGWDRSELLPIQFEDPRWGCNVDNAETIREQVDDLLRRTGQDRVDIIAHSMGALSSRHYVKFLGGVDKVNVYVSLGGLHHGNRTACLNPLDVCVWQELCPTHPFIAALDADPAAPGLLHWVSVYSTDDGTVPTEVSYLEGAENIEIHGVVHAGPGGLTEDEGVYREVTRVLQYPRW